ncbi:MAG: HEAT repeat domain-containing protein [Nitrospirota bacterium]
MKEQKHDKLPIDAKLLSDAIIELNISRRSVGLYPPDHPIVTESIENAFGYLKKLFELRVDITLGIAKDTLVVDEYSLDSKNPVFREFAYSLHSKGIAAVTFSSGLTKEELIALHELLTSKDSPSGKAFSECAKNKNIRHIVLTPVDFSIFRFVEGAQKFDGKTPNIWEDYVYGLLEGKLGGEEEGAILTIPPEYVASYINAAMKDDRGEEAYDRVITSYIRKKEKLNLSSESLNKFFLFIDNLNPELKSQFLMRSRSHFSKNVGEAEKIIENMTSEDFQRISRLLTENSSVIPNALKNLIDKLTSIKKTDARYFDFFYDNTAILHDIEIDGNISKLFGEDHFNVFVSEDYSKTLEKMLKSAPSGGPDPGIVKSECDEEHTDKIALEIMLELLDADSITDEEYLAIITKLSDFINVFMSTGRFEEILEIYNTLSSHALTGRFSDNASGMTKFYFHSEEFISNLIDAFMLWGRKNRDSVMRLAKALKHSLITPLLDLLTEETEPGMRKFFLSILVHIGTDVSAYAVKRLNDSRWYVVRNMLYLLRECNSRKDIPHIRKFAKHENISIRIEAMKCLLHFKTPDSVSFLKLYLQSEETDLRRNAIRLAGAYKVAEAVPYLVRIIEKKDLFGKDFYFKSEAIKALGEIGDGKTVKCLINLYNSKALFYKAGFESLKIEIFRTLDNYPYNSIRELLTLGLDSRNEEIRSISENLFSKNQPSLQKGEPDIV